MASESVRHDAAWGISRDIMGIFRSLLMDHEVRDAHAEVLNAVTGGLARFEEQLDRLRHRLAPEGHTCK
jgi:hypothetical protein